MNRMSTIAQRDLQQRAQKIGAIHTLAQAEERKQFVRRQLLNDLGGLPDDDGPLNAKVPVDSNDSLQSHLQSDFAITHLCRRAPCTDARLAVATSNDPVSTISCEDFPTITSNVPGTTFQ